MRMVMRALLGLLLPFAAMSAQGTTVPLSGEAKHHLVLENSHTRIYDVVVPAGDSTLYHVHANDYVYVTLGNASLEAQALGAAQTKLDLADGEVRYTKGPITHRVLNPSTTPFHNLTIEVLGPANVTLARRAAGDSVLENDRVRVTRLVLEPGAKVATQEHRGPWLLVAVHAGELSIGEGDLTVLTSVTAGWYEWFDAHGGERIANRGRTAVELVEIEWK